MDKENQGRFKALAWFSLKKNKKLQQKQRFYAEKQYQENRKENIFKRNTNPKGSIRNRIPCIFCHIEYEHTFLYKRHMEEVHQGISFPYSRESPERIESLPEELIQKQDYYELFYEGVGITDLQRDSPFRTPVIGRTIQVQKYITNLESSVEILGKLQKKRKDQ